MHNVNWRALTEITERYAEQSEVRGFILNVAAELFYILNIVLNFKTTIYRLIFNTYDSE